MSVVIIDSGFFNLSSIYFSVKRLGYNPIVSFDKNIIKNSTKLIFPAFGNSYSVMKYLYKMNLVKIIKNYKKPILGICSGMHVFFNSREENKNISMLDIFHKEYLYKIKAKKFPIFHTGWNKVYFKQKNLLFKNINNGDWFYFIHSYIALISSVTIAKTCYESFFSSAVQKKNFFGVQFHPELSGNSGMIVLKNFLEI
ncbi:Imidazole glycerol phosphate synthase subunit HisH [Buchnera aphidicola (Periphyllus testudinaceus)]|uniref:imidazole glycerol phosphate synthase subunit HisH n=1 Tax=Buchnera aphidicola TaxID=9 RepID=UPI0034639E3C